MISCPGCQESVQLAADVIIHEESLHIGRWSLLCYCGHAFTVSNLIDAGATRKRGRQAIKDMN